MGVVGQLAEALMQPSGLIEFCLLRFIISTALSVEERERVLSERASLTEVQGLPQCHCRRLFKTREVWSPQTNTDKNACCNQVSYKKKFGQGLSFVCG